MRFFIYSYADLKTGGAELLHQLCHRLSALGVENYMIYYGNAPGDADLVPEVYRKYDVKYVRHYIDAEDSILVLPETMIEFIDQCKRGRVMIWWLSVDNYLKNYSDLIKDDKDIFDLRGRQNVSHYVQSLYAGDFVKNNFGAEPLRLSDYISEDIALTAERMSGALERENACVYNPKKGFEDLEPVIAGCRDDIKWIPLENMTPQMLAETCCRAKVYIDLGSHPGKDRMPREAALCGCAVITGKLGSAAYKDVDIPEQYKIEDTGDIKGILDVIYGLMDGFEERAGDFRQYVFGIEKEREMFDEDVRMLVERYAGLIGTSGNAAFGDWKYPRLLRSAKDTMDGVIDRLEGIMSGGASSLPEVRTGLAELDCLIGQYEEILWSIEDRVSKYKVEI